MTQTLYVIVFLALIFFSAGLSWVSCVPENGVCLVGNSKARAITSFCADNQCTYKESRGTSVTCSDSYFGDPSYGNVKSCSYYIPDPSDTSDAGNWIYLGSEGSTLQVPNDGYTYQVRFCDSSSTKCYYRVVSQSFPCTDSYFGDPDYGIVKHCDYRVQPAFGPENTWNSVAQEGETFDVSSDGSQNWVKFGAGQNYNYRLLSGKGISCSDVLFDDPDVGTVKNCLLLQSTIQATIPVGKWVLIETCEGCTISTSIDEGVSSTITNTQSSTITNGFSIAISQGFEYDVGLASGSTTVTLGYSYSDAIETATSSAISQSVSQTCSCSCGDEPGDYSVWQWQMSWTQSSDFGDFDSLSAVTCNWICKTDTSSPACPLTLCNPEDECSTCSTSTGTLSGCLSYSYLGCGAVNSILPLAQISTTMSVELCSSQCSQNYGSPYFAVQGTYCYCGASKPSSLTSSCTEACPGNSNEKCGGNGVASVYSVVLPSSSGNAISSLFSYIGCGVDSNPPRAFTNYAGSSPLMTPQRCYELCLNLLTSPTHFGVQDSQNCYCANDYKPLKLGLASSSQCNLPCSGNSNFNCGGTSENSVYRIGVLPSDLTVYADVADGTTQDEDSQLPTWVIPVSVVGGVVVIAVLIAVIVLLVKRKSNSDDTPYEIRI